MDYERLANPPLPRHLERRLCPVPRRGSGPRDRRSPTADLGPAERRHWEMFYRLAGRNTDEQVLAARFQGWRESEAELARGLGTSPAVHG